LVGAIVVYALVARKLDRVWVTGPIIFIVVGFALGSGGGSRSPVGHGFGDRARGDGGGPWPSYCFPMLPPSV